MSQLGNYFSPQQKQDFVDRNFKEGAVFSFFCYKANKLKRFILLGFKFDKNEIAFLHINSEINPNVFHIQALRDEHIPLVHCDERQYLDHDSFVNCSEFIIRKTDEIEQLFSNDISIHIGELSEEDLKIIRQAVSKSKVLRRGLKKDFGCSFG